MKFILIGKSGLIGSSIEKLLKDKNQHINTYGRSSCDNFLDLNRFNLKQTSNKICDTLIHCAGITDEEIESNKELSIRKNTEGLVRLVDWAKESGVKKFIYLSSAHVYGNLNKKIDENSKTCPQSLYGTLHLFAENYIRSVFEDYLILRPLSVYGDAPNNFKRWRLIPFSFPNDLAKKNIIILKTHGKQGRNFISTDTISKSIWDFITKNKIGIINLIGYHSMSIIEFSRYCIEVLNEKYIENDLKVEYKSDFSYKNQFDYRSNVNQYLENKNKLRKHILATFKKGRKNE